MWDLIEVFNFLKDLINDNVVTYTDFLHYLTLDLEVMNTSLKNPRVNLDIRKLFFC